MWALVLVLLLAGVAYGGYRWLERTEESTPAGSPPPEAEPTLGGLPLSQFYLEHDRFLAAIDPETIPADAAGWLRDDDEVFGLVVGDRARAYPITMLSYHHVVNDVIEGIPVAVTY